MTRYHIHVSVSELSQSFAISTHRQPICGEDTPVFKHGASTTGCCS
jgi:hypothetical protein